MKHLYLTSCAAVLIACSPNPVLAPADPEAPLPVPARRDLNVLVISFDALRADALGTYGAPAGTSPHLDRFARRAVVFEHARSVSPVTPTSFASMFSGRPPLEVFRDWRFESETTLAELFQRAGYATGGFFHNPQLVRQRGFGRGFDVYQVEQDRSGAADAGVAEDARRWLEATPEPFFAWVHLLDPHAPWERLDASASFYDDDYEGSYGESGPGNVLAVHDRVELARLHSLYAGEVHAVDAVFGNLIAAFDHTGLGERTVVLITADHGEGLMDHGHLQHSQLFEEDVHIPLIVRHPDLDEGSRVALAVDQQDILSTLASLAGLEPPPSAKGRDLRRRSEARPQLGVGYTADTVRRASLTTTDGRKLMIDCRTPPRPGLPRTRLYDLSSDPDERRNLARRQPEEARTLETRMWAELGIAGCQALRMNLGPQGRRANDGLEPETIRQLEALGYADQD